MENTSRLRVEGLVGSGSGSGSGPGSWVEGWPDPDSDVVGFDGPGVEAEHECPFEVWQEVMEELLQAVDPPPGVPEMWQLTDGQLLAELDAAQRSRARAEARWLGLLAEAERRQACENRAGLGTVGWLVHQNTHSPRRARQEVGLARSVHAQPTVAAALAAGRLSMEQAGVICHGLEQLPEELGAGEREQVTGLVLDLAGEFGPAALRRLVAHAVEVVAPEVAEDADRRAVERAERSAERSRYLSWHRDLDGGLLISGKLCAVDGDRFEALIKAHAARQTTSEALSENPTPWSAACADALATIFTHYAGCRAAPRHGGDRPRVIVTLDLKALLDGLGSATLLGSGERITAATARRLACDAGIIPAILDGDSRLLDLGREQRLFTGPVRRALVVRDQGCAFPGCDRQPADCDGHHLVPWWAGGETKLTNAVLLCQRHHKQIEPDPRQPPGSQWEARLDPHGLPEFLAPAGRGHDPGDRVVRQHHRYRLRRRGPQLE